MRSSREKGKTMFKKVGRVALAAAFASSMMIPAAAVSAFADGPDEEIKVTAIAKGDSAAYYQVIEYDSTNAVWKLTDAFLSLDLSSAQATADPNKTTLDYIMDGITAAEAALIAAKASGSGTAMTPATAGNDGELKATVNPGMYLVIASSKDNANAYQPMFVSADYTEGGNSLAATSGFDDTNNAVAKKTPVSIDKKLKDSSQVDVAYGDTVTFQITTNIPSYEAYAIDPTFEVSDSLSTGLTLDPALSSTDPVNVKVTVAGYASPTYTVTPDEEHNGFKVTFDSDWLKTVKGNPAVTIEYTAKVTQTAAVNYNVETNTASLKYSNNPTDNSSFGTDDDKTTNYSFGIDANVNGNKTEGSVDEDVTHEILKVNDVETTTTVTTTTENITTYEAKGLEGAEFTLWNSDKTKSVATATSSGVGALSFKGLDAGTYYLQETKAPAGYKLDSTYHEVIIAAEYDTDADGDKYLKSYTITIDGEATSTYTMSYSNDDPMTITSQKIETTSKTKLINNQKQDGLPTTGGMGTMGLTAAGVVLIAGGALFFLRNRRRNEQQ